MKNAWLSAVVLAVSLAVSACGGTQETWEEAEQISVDSPGTVEAMPYMCTTEGLCPKGYYCDGGPGGICRRQLVEAMLYPCNDEGLCPTGYYCDGGSVCRRGYPALQ